MPTWAAMSELPTGTVTFVFTDIEGSTSMLQRLGDAFVTVLEDHNRVIRGAFGDGTEIRSEGDAFFYVFSSAPDALLAACAAQRRLADFAWPEGGTVMVRIGMHTGEGVAGGDDYVGLDVHRAARIAASGHGGQILVSEATQVLSVSTLTPEVTLVDLGEHRFKDIEEAEHLYQAVVRGLPTDFPPITSLDVAPNNLPTQPTGFVGRTSEVEEVSELVEQYRLVTLTGPGGSGKTRLALRVASTLQAGFPDGVFYVPLESLRSPELVVTELAERLGVTNGAGDSLLETVIDTSAQKAMLLLIDNFEHVLAASEDVSALLGGAPLVKIVVTSQTPLRIRGERVYPVPPLAANDAVEMFAELAVAADPSFVLDDEVRPMVDEVVDLLERLPLALELTAPRIQLFGLRGLRDRLSDRLEIPAVGLADVPERHRSLSDAIAWSYDLLENAGQSLLRQLSIFDGGFTLEGAEAVVDPSSGVAEGVAALLDRSLLRSQVTRGEVRFSMLEAIRLFALEELINAVQRDAAALRHAEYFVDLAETAGPLLDGESQQVWLDRLADEHDNLRAVLRLSRDSSDPDSGLRTAGSTWRFYHRRGHLREGREWLELLLAMDGASTEATATGIEGLAGIAYWQADYAAAKRLYVDLLDLYRELGDDEKVADTLFALATTTQWLGDLEGGRDYAEQARSAYEKAGAPHGAARVAAAIGWNIWQAGRIEEALESWIEARAEYAAIGDDGEVRQTDLAISAMLGQLGRADESISLAAETLEAMVEANDASGTIMAIDFLAPTVAATSPAPAVRLAGAADHLRGEAGGGLSADSVGLEPVRSMVADAMDDADIEAAWSQGQSLTLDEAVSLGREVVANTDHT